MTCLLSESFTDSALHFRHLSDRKQRVFLSILRRRKDGNSRLTTISRNDRMKNDDGSQRLTR